MKIAIGGVFCGVEMLKRGCNIFSFFQLLPFLLFVDAAYADDKVPQITPFDSELSFVTNEIFYEGRALHRPSVSSDLGAMTVEGFPGIEGHVQRFQVTNGCANNNWDCREENQSSFTRRNEVSLPRNRERNNARIGDTTIVEYEVFIASNPDFPNLAIFNDFFHFGQFHGAGDEDVPYQLGVATVRHFPAPMGLERVNHGDLAIMIRSVIFPQILRNPSDRYAILLARQGDFEDQWHKIRFEINWKNDESGRAAFYFNEQLIFECANCITAPINEMAAITDGRRVNQSFYFKYGIYNWRQWHSRTMSEEEPPTVVAYYRNISWENIRD